jgi:hypothetical protein
MILAGLGVFWAIADNESRSVQLGIRRNAIEALLGFPANYP